MVRVAVIGNGGGGKTTMCRLLSCALNIPFYPIDQIQWKPGWQPAPPDEFREKREHILAQEKWIIDG
jgi:adenylate kinase family enzyme